MSAADPAEVDLVERGRTVFFARAERLYEDGGDGLSLDALVDGLTPENRVAVRAFLAASLASEPVPKGMATK